MPFVIHDKAKTAHRRKKPGKVMINSAQVGLSRSLPPGTSSQPKLFGFRSRKAKQFKIPLTPAFESCESILDGVVVKQREARKRREKARKEREREGKAQGNDVHSALAMRVTVETMSGECVTADHAGNPSMEDHSTDKAVAKAGLTRTEKNRKKRHRYKANKRLRKLANI